MISVGGTVQPPLDSHPWGSININLSPMQTKKSQPEGKLIMPEKRFTSFLAFSVDPRVWIFLTALETDD